MAQLLQPGDTIRLETTFTIDDVLTDPSNVTLTVNSPDGSSDDYDYSQAEIVKAGTGDYYIDFTAPDAGLYVWRWVGTGLAQGIDEGSFTVVRDLVQYPGLCSVDDVKANHQIAESTSDDQIAGFIAMASDILTNEYQREFSPIEQSPDPIRTLKVEGRLVDLTPYDLRSVTSITMHPGDTSELVLSASDYNLEPLSKPYGSYTWLSLAPTVSLTSGFATSFNYGLVEIQGKWGMPLVPQAVSRACVLTVVSWLRSDPGNWFNQATGDPTPTFPTSPGSFAIPLAARNLMNPFIRYRAMVG